MLKYGKFNVEEARKAIDLDEEPIVRVQPTRVAVAHSICATPPL